MRFTKLNMHLLFLALLGVTLAGCDMDKRPTLAAQKASSVSSATPSGAEASIVALPKFTALVK